MVSSTWLGVASRDSGWNTIWAAQGFKNDWISLAKNRWQLKWEVFSTLYFKGYTSSARETWNTGEKFKSKTREEINASGISVAEPSKFDIMMEEIVGLFESNEEHREKEKEEKCQDEKNLAEETRLKALETIGETRKSESEDDGDLPSVSTKRRATLAYFKEKHWNDLDIKQQENEERKQKIELRKSELQLQKAQNENLMKLLVELAKKYLVPSKTLSTANQMNVILLVVLQLMILFWM